SHDIATAHVPASQVLQSPASVVFEFDAAGSARSRLQAGVTANAGLDAGFLIRTDNAVSGSKRFFLPKTRIKIEDDLRFASKLRIAWIDPIFVAPRFQVRLMKDAPDGAAADRFAQSDSGSLRQVGQRLPAQRLLRFEDDLTGDRLDGSLIQRGKN